MSANEATPLHSTGEWASTWMLSGVGISGVTRSYSLPTIPASTLPSCRPVPSNTQASGSAMTMSASTGLHS